MKKRNSLLSILFLIWASDSLILTEFKICESSLLSSHITSIILCYSGCDTNTGYCLAVVSGGCCLLLGESGCKVLQ